MTCYVNNCFTKTNNVCINCKMVSYCSVTCKKIDWSIHKQMCHPSPNLRLKGMCQISVKYNMDNFLFTLSKLNELTVKSSNSEYEHHFSAFNVPYYCECCPICSTLILYDGDYEDLEAYVYFEGRNIEYYRCVDCATKNKLLCRTSFLETSICRSIYENKLRDILMCIPFLIEWLNTDVMSYIMNFVSLCLLPCEGCQCYY